MTDPSTPRLRRVRSVTESLLSIVLVLESALVFFIALTRVCLDLLPPNVTLGGGIVFILVQLVTGAMLRQRRAEWLGWGLQFALVALDFLLPALLIGAAFF